jgi:hypothetical protein
MSTQSTGPRSDEGKERSSLNATRHGLCSDRPVIPGEDAAEWDAFRDCVVRRWLPADDYEKELAERIALQMWRFRRVTRLETQLFNDALNDDPAPRPAVDHAEAVRELADLERQVRRLERARVIVAHLHNLPGDTPVDGEAAWLLGQLCGAAPGRPVPAAATADWLRRDLIAAVKKPQTHALLLAAERVEVEHSRCAAQVAEKKALVEKLGRHGAAPDHLLPLEEALRRVQRYEAHVSRQLAQAVKLLEKAQAERRASEATGQKSEVGSKRSGAGVPQVPEAVARRSQLPARDEAEPEGSFRISGTGAADGTSFGNSAPEPSKAEPPGPAEVADQFVRHLAAGQLNGVAAPAPPEATA